MGIRREVELGLLCWTICVYGGQSLPVYAPLGVVSPVAVEPVFNYDDGYNTGGQPQATEETLSARCSAKDGGHTEIERFYPAHPLRPKARLRTGLTVSIPNISQYAHVHICTGGQTLGTELSFEIGVYHDENGIDDALYTNGNIFGTKAGSRLSDATTGGVVHIFPHQINWGRLDLGNFDGYEIVMRSYFSGAIFLKPTPSIPLHVRFWPHIVVNELLEDTTPVEVAVTTPVYVVYNVICEPIYENCYHETTSSDYEKGVTTIMSSDKATETKTYHDASGTYQSNITLYMPRPGTNPTKFEAVLYQAMNLVYPACAA